jgi:uncharacterized protein YccT (UPF0319 family)
MKYVVLALALSVLSANSYANLVKLAQGVEIHAVNGEKVKSAEDIHLVQGKNQLVLSFGGKLIDGGKTEHYSAPPYVVVATLNSVVQTEITLKSKRLSTITKSVKSGLPIFEISQEGADIPTSQEVLPPDDAFLPYANIEHLVKEYNQERGLIFESGTIRELKKELDQLDNSKVLNTEIIAESEASLQLKIWYTRASTEEKQEFSRWMSDQE